MQEVKTFTFLESNVERLTTSDLDPENVCCDMEKDVDEGLPKFEVDDEEFILLLFPFKFAEFGPPPVPVPQKKFPEIFLIIV